MSGDSPEAILEAIGEDARANPLRDTLSAALRAIETCADAKPEAERAELRNYLCESLLHMIAVETAVMIAIVTKAPSQVLDVFAEDMEITLAAASNKVREARAEAAA